MKAPARPAAAVASAQAASPSPIISKRAAAAAAGLNAPCWLPPQGESSAPYSDGGSGSKNISI